MPVLTGRLRTVINESPTCKQFLFGLAHGNFGSRSTPPADASASPPLGQFSTVHSYNYARAGRAVIRSGMGRLLLLREEARVPARGARRGDAGAGFRSPAGRAHIALFLCPLDRGHCRGIAGSRSGGRRPNSGVRRSAGDAAQLDARIRRPASGLVHARPGNRRCLAVQRHVRHGDPGHDDSARLRVRPSVGRRRSRVVMAVRPLLAS